jgi:hypothetical protein
MDRAPLIYRQTVRAAVTSLLSVLTLGPLLACETPSTETYVDLDNDYAANSALVVYQAFWEATSFQAPIQPGSSSGPQSTVPASGATAYVVLAPGWDPDAGGQPTSFVLLQSRQTYGVRVADTLHIPVDDATFVGNCKAKSFLTQSQADFMTRLVFPDVFGKKKYDAVTCTTTPIGDAGVD